VTAPLLALEGVHTHIGAYHILHGVDFAVPTGQLTLLLGRNGAGKTTTLRTIMGLWKASRGRVLLAGEDIAGLSTPEIARRGVSYVPESMDIFSELTVAENLVVGARGARRVRDIDATRLAWIFGLFPPIKDLWHYRGGLLSGGQKQMLAIARAIVEPCKLLLIDEPSKGLAPAIIQRLIGAFQELKRTDTTILLVEQNFGFARQLGDTVAVLDDGRIVHAGTLAAMADDDGLQQRLLGLSLTGHPTLTAERPR
jgi:branched-chain amino acid transport system ATP-binding protein